MSNHETIEFLEFWEVLSNENFNSAEFSLIKTKASKNLLRCYQVHDVPE